MDKVTQEEIVEALTFGIGNAYDRIGLANRIEAHGIAPPDGCVIVPSEKVCAELNESLYNSIVDAKDKP